MPKKSRAKFEFEQVVDGKGPIKVVVRASSYLNDDVRDKMIPMLGAASYMVNRIIHRLRKGKDAEGGANPKKRDGRPMTFYRTGYMFRHFTPKAASPLRVTYGFTGAHKEVSKAGFTKRQTGTTKSGKAKHLGNADLARLLNASHRVAVDIHQPSKAELAEMDRLARATMTGALLTELGKDSEQFNAEKKVRTALAKAKKAANKGTPKGI
jgi:hypothetical protein